MPRMIILGRGGVIDAQRVVAIGSARSAPVKRLLKSIAAEKVLDLTYGYPRESVILLDNGYLAIVSRTVGELARALDDGTGKDLSHENQPPWW